MAKGQIRSTKEKRKPKADKKPKPVQAGSGGAKLPPGKK
jgi:hypothetical protein